jgi:uncharacterized membrane protein
MSANHELIYGKMNYILIAIGAVLVASGFILMAGGGAELGPDGYAHEFDESIYSFRRISLAPIVIMIGFITVAVAILKKFKKAE